MPTGTLTKKIHGQEKYCVRTPPRIRPTAEPPIAIAAQTASARARSAPSSKVVEMIESAAGEISAAPRPCNAREPTSIASLEARPSRSEAPVKITRPSRKSRLRPSRSPARPPSRRKPPKTSVYALTIHCRLPSERWRSLWIEGRATFTIVASSTTMNCARQIRTRTTQGLVACLRTAAPSFTRGNFSLGAGIVADTCAERKFAMYAMFCYPRAREPGDGGPSGAEEAADARRNRPRRARPLRRARLRGDDPGRDRRGRGRLHTDHLRVLPEQGGHPLLR